MKRRSFTYTLVAAAAGLVLVAILGFSWLTARSPLSLLRGGGQAQPEAAIFVPRQAPLMVSLLVNPDRLEAFRVAIAPSGKRSQARKELEQVKQSLLGKRGLNYEQDIQPWLGDEITLAVTTADVDRDEDNGSQPGYLLVVSTKDTQRAREFVQLFWQKQAIAGINLNFEQYAGVKIIYGTSQPPIASDAALTASLAPTPTTDRQPSPPIPTLASAVVGDRFVLFANYPKVLRDAINNVQASHLNLEQSDIYQRALAQLPNHQIGSVFVNFPQLERWIGQSLGQTSTGATAASLPVYESLTMGLGLNRSGLLIETVLSAASQASFLPRTPALLTPATVMQFIPVDSPLVAVGVDLRTLWHQLMAEDSLLTALLRQALVPLQTRWGMANLAEIGDWVDGEYALALVPTRQPELAEWLFVAQRSPAVITALGHLDEVARQQGLSVGPLQLENQSVVTWAQLSTVSAHKPSSNTLTLQADIKGTHTTTGNYEVLATSIKTIDRILKPEHPSFLETADFQEAIAPLAQPNDGYLYIDWQQLRPQIKERIPLVRLGDLIAKPVFDHLRSLTISSYGSEANIRRGGIFVRFQDVP